MSNKVKNLIEKFSRIALIYSEANQAKNTLDSASDFTLNGQGGKLPLFGRRMLSGTYKPQRHLTSCTQQTKFSI